LQNHLPNPFAAYPTKPSAGKRRRNPAVKPARVHDPGPEWRKGKPEKKKVDPGAVGFWRRQVNEKWKQKETEKKASPSAQLCSLPSLLPSLPFPTSAEAENIVQREGCPPLLIAAGRAAVRRPEFAPPPRRGSLSGVASVAGAGAAFRLPSSGPAGAEIRPDLGRSAVMVREP